MSQEAKGLDAGPRLAEKLVGCGDNRSAAIVSRIAAEEKAHVAVGESLQSCFAHHLSCLLRPSCSAFSVSLSVCLSVYLFVCWLCLLTALDNCSGASICIYLVCASYCDMPPQIGAGILVTIAYAVARLNVNL